MILADRELRLALSAAGTGNSCPPNSNCAAREIRVVLSRVWSPTMPLSDTLPAPAPASLLARAIFELTAIGAPVTALGVLCWMTDAGATDDEARAALDQLAAAQDLGVAA